LTPSGIEVKTYMPGGTKATAVYDPAFNCLTSAYKQNKNTYYILKL